ncbi:lytic transglycosylase domain-containing protein [Hafnia paralvei]|uniref:lytic transglycosylase domain-containing protein n=1 Tax=Hafnia paralvei TaxID=546367 RepID=UPI0010334B0B|nr:lytic transglycosylase domain-containing protein [Hafnia paralvei]TBL55585.1 lytic transglycosylase domain-containing protein [Hafnia paralvei]
MATVIDALIVTLGLDASGFKKGKSEVSEGLDQTKKKAESTAKDMEVYGKKASSFFTSIGKSMLALAGVALSANGVKNFINDTTKSLVDLGVQASAIDTSAKSLDGWVKSAEAVGSTASAMSSNLQKFQSSISQFNSGFGADDTLNTLFAFSAQTNTKFDTNQNASQIMKYLAENWNKLNKDQQKYYGQRLGLDNATVQSLSSGKMLELQRSFEGTSKQTDALTEKARRLLEQFVRVRQSWESTSLTLYEKLLPAVWKIIDALDDLNSWVDRHGEEINASFDELGKTFSILWKDVTDASSAVGNLLSIDTKNWSLSADIKDLNENLDEGRKTVELIIDAFKSLFNLDFSSFGDKVKSLFKMGNGEDALPGVTDSANSAADYVKEKTGMDPRNAGKWLGEKAEALKNMFSGETSRLEKEHGLPEGLLTAQVAQESGWNPNAVSHAGAKGLMQIMPDTARDLGIHGSEFDPKKSLEAGAKYMGSLLKRYGGDVQKALTAYNWGMGNLEKKGMGNAPEEARNYAPQIIARMQASQRYSSQAGGNGQSGTNITFKNTTIKTDARSMESLAKDAASKGMAQSSLTQSFLTGQNS